MSKKQKKTLVRILISAVLLVVAALIGVAIHFGVFTTGF